MENEKQNPEAMTSEEIARAAVKVLDDNKAHDIKLLSVRDKTVLTDYFVICSGTSNTQIRALSAELEYKLGEAGITPIGIEGYDTGTWIAMDYAHVIIHIFSRDMRDFYKLEKLWGDAEEIPVSSLDGEAAQ